MNNSREMAIMIGGAVIGGVAGYVFFTERGRHLRRQIEPALAGYSRELMSLRDTVQKSAGVVNEGWKKMVKDTKDTLSEGGKPSARYPNGQTSPL